MVTEDPKPKKKTGFQKTLEFLKKYEGFRDTVYLDGNGIPTIGYGFTDPALIKKGKITRAEADKRLEQEVRTREKELRGKIKGWGNLADDSKTALLSYYFNYPAGFKDTTRFMQNWNAGNYYAAIKEVDAGMNDENNPGLRKRRLAEQALLNADPYFGIIKRQTPDGITIANMPDGNKVMKISPRMYERPQYEPEFKLYHDPKTIYPLDPAAREVPESLDAWNGADSPSKGPRMPSLTKQLEDLQRDNPLNRGFKPEATMYGRRRLSPLSLKLPSLDQMLDLGSPQQQLTEYFADALQVPRMHLDVLPAAKDGKDALPQYGDGTENTVEQGIPVDDEYYDWYNNWLSNRTQQFDENFSQSSDSERQYFSKRNSETIDQQLQNIKNARVWTNRQQYVNESPEKIYSMKGVEGAVRYGKDGNRIYVSVPGLYKTYGDHWHDVLAHEISHSLYNVPQGVDYGDAKEDPMFNSGVTSPQTSKINSINKQYSGSLYHPGFSPDSYKDNPDEILAELNEYRKRTGLDPKYVVKSEDLDAWRAAGGKLEMPDTLKRFSNEVLLRYFNDVAQIGNNSYSGSDVRMLPRAKNGKDALPKCGDGLDGLLEKYDQFVEDDPYYAATVLSYLPFIGTAMDVREAIKNPTAENIGYAALSGITDAVGGRIFTKIAGKTIKARKAANAARKAEYEYWKNTPFIQNMPKKQGKQTLKFYADRAADKAREQIIDDPTFQIDGFNIAAGLGAYAPDFVANMNQHKTK